MIVSVSMFGFIKGAATALTCVNFSIVSPDLARVCDAAGQGRGRRHGRAGEVRARARPLPADEIAVAGRHGTLAGCDDVAIDPGAHRAAGLAPFDPGAGAHLVVPFA